jgi:cell division protein FtsQ
VELGRGSEAELLARTERFVRTLAQATSRWHAPLEYADLRHADGYAVRLRGVSTTSPAAAAAKTN